ncbi:MAG: lipoyl synthase [Methanomassiliicoccales archaeon]
MITQSKSSKPEWIKIKLGDVQKVRSVREILNQCSVRTVCDSSQCPNLGQCWERGAVTFLILGQICTRYCRFCAVSTGNPNGVLDEEEPERVAQAVEKMGLNYVVVTSVTRDDLQDGGAKAFANTVKAIKSMNRDVKVELLLPDFQCHEDALRIVSRAGADVLAHNLEVVRRLQESVRDAKAGYESSLFVLKELKSNAPQTPVKTSIMLGLGETEEEIFETMMDARKAGVDFINLGQYLQPKGVELRVQRYIKPEEFIRFREWGLSMGFKEVMAGPLVRSSYRARDMLLGGE